MLNFSGKWSILLGKLTIIAGLQMLVRAFHRFKMDKLTMHAHNMKKDN